MTVSADRAVMARDTPLAEPSREFLPGDREGNESLANPAAASVEEVKTSNRRYNQRFCLVATLFGLVSTLFLVWMIVLGASRTRIILDNVVQLSAALVAVAVCAEAARRNRQRWTGWALLTASFFVTQCGNAIWCYYDILHGEPVSASMAADVSIALALPLAVAALLTFPNALGTAASHLRELLDAVLIGTGMFFIGWTLVLSPVYDHQSGGVIVEIFNLAYPSVDILIASLVIILATRPGSGYRIRLGLVSAGLLSCAVADCSFSYLTAVHRYGTGNPTDAGWALGYLLIALGALWAWNHPVVRHDITGRPTVRTLIGPNLHHVRAVDLRKLWVFMMEQRQLRTLALRSRRTVVHIPAHVRDEASSGSAHLFIAPPNQEAWTDEDDVSQNSGATVLVVSGFVVIFVVAGAIRVRSNKSYRLTVGAMTRWACGHAAILSDPLDPGVTVATASCPFCGRPGIVGQYVGRPLGPSPLVARGTRGTFQGSAASRLNVRRWKRGDERLHRRLQPVLRSLEAYPFQVAGP